MILEGYRIEIFNNPCMPGAMSVNCIAHLYQDVGPALPYLNTQLGGFEYICEPPSVSFRVYGKLLVVRAREIAINALKDETEAFKIVEWLQNEINRVWADRDQIEPRYTGMARVSILEILMRLPKTNCQECGASTCMVFATQVAEGAKDASHCPPMIPDQKKALNAYLAKFSFDH